MKFGEINEQERDEIYDHLELSRSNECIRMAESILDLKAERDYLLKELMFYKPYRRLYMEATQSSIDHSRNMVGMVLNAALDKGSVLNKVWKAENETN